MWTETAEAWIEDGAEGRAGGAEARLGGAVTRLLATVSHEFRTPLNGILGMAGLLEETRLDAEQRSYVAAIRSSAEAFLNLVDEILDHSRIEGGHVTLAEAPLDPGALVQGVVELLAPRAQGKGIAIAASVARDLPQRVLGDADRLRQVLLNLAGNATKFTEAGAVGLRVEPAGPDRLLFAVEDTGPGIPESDHEAIFREFEQGTLPGAERNGTGLGLAITRSLVHRMGGTIRLASEPGRGSRFEVELPLRFLAEESAGLPAMPEGLPVLILSATPFEGEYLARTLAESGASPVLARSLDEARSLLAERVFGALIADQALASSDLRGIAADAERHGVARRINLLSPFERRDLGSPHASGFDAYLIKPVRTRSLLERLTETARPATSAEPCDARLAPTRLQAGARVLLAEDNDINALLATRALETEGARVDRVWRGEEAVERALDAERLGSPYDLILMDLRMPGLDGGEAARLIRRRAAGPARPFMVALTASAALLGPEAGKPGALFDDLVTKPFAPDALRRLLARAVSQNLRTLVT